jgi:hypothetical protein
MTEVLICSLNSYLSFGKILGHVDEFVLDFVSYVQRLVCSGMRGMRSFILRLALAGRLVPTTASGVNRN